MSPEWLWLWLCGYGCLCHAVCVWYTRLQGGAASLVALTNQLTQAPPPVMRRSACASAGPRETGVDGRRRPTVKAQSIYLSQATGQLLLMPVLSRYVRHRLLLFASSQHWELQRLTTTTTIVAQYGPVGIAATSRPLQKPRARLSHPRQLQLTQPLHSPTTILAAQHSSYSRY